MNISSYQLNHPKAYIGYALALEHGGSRNNADELTRVYVTAGNGMARRGAENLNLIESDTSGNAVRYSLTDTGASYCEIILHRLQAESGLDVLERLDEMRGARNRFIEDLPQIRDILPCIAREDPTIDRLVEHLHRIHRERQERGLPFAIDMADVFWETWKADPAFAGEMFIRDHDGIREIVLGGSTDPEDWKEMEATDVSLEPIEYNQMADGAPVYRSSTTYQLKNIMYHMGLVQDTGTQTKDMSPHKLTWALEPGHFDEAQSTSSEISGDASA